jgi:NhaA family Na+:H+ antiporter
VARLASRPVERFLQIEAASGILLLIAATIALVCANSPLAAIYQRFWHLPVGISLGTLHVQRSLEWVVNDVLMVIFFFVVGLEIRREVHHGELSDTRRALLPAAAALGGMVVPAVIYAVIARGSAARAGWGVPMATDIAFAVGVLALLGKRVPAALRVLLLALAVIDDLGAIAVIALFYSGGIAVHALFLAVTGLCVIYALQALGVRRKWMYIPPAVLVWFGIYRAGIHPTIAGVIIGIVTPVRAWLGAEGFLRDVQQRLNTLTKRDVSALDDGAIAELSENLQPSQGQLTQSTHATLPAISGAELAAVVREVNRARREALSPAESLIETLHPWVAYAIMPLFALANAGVALGKVGSDANVTVAMVGASVGLLVGKPMGVILACVLTTKLRLTALPAGLSHRHVVVLGCTAGVGFTMALFVAQLAFGHSAPLLGAAKVGVLVGSAVAAVLALALGRVLLGTAGSTMSAHSDKSPHKDIAQSADEAESSTEK